MIAVMFVRGTFIKIWTKKIPSTDQYEGGIEFMSRHSTQEKMHLESNAWSYHSKGSLECKPVIEIPTSISLSTGFEFCRDLPITVPSRNLPLSRVYIDLLYKYSALYVRYKSEHLC